MDEVSTDQVPEGFSPVPRGQGFSDNLQPSYRRIEGDSVSFGLVVQSQHGNLMGICHGGVLMTLADIAAANGVNVARGVKPAVPPSTWRWISLRRPGWANGYRPTSIW